MYTVDKGLNFELFDQDMKIYKSPQKKAAFWENQ